LRDGLLRDLGFGATATEDVAGAHARAVSSLSV
jgi:hypothetical protein